MLRERCARCGEETAAGSVLFSDREKVARKGHADAFFCGECAALIRGSGKSARLTEEDVEAFRKNASAAFIVWTSNR